MYYGKKTGLAPGGAYGVSEIFIYLVKFIFYLKRLLIHLNHQQYLIIKKTVYLDTNYLWHSNNLGDANRRRVPPSMIGESRKLLF